MCLSKWVSVCETHSVKLTGIRVQPESSSSIRSMMWSALKAFFKHCWVQFVRLSSELHPEWCESQAVTCYEADLARYTLCVSGLCLADLEGTEWAGLWRMRAYAWMFLPFLEEAHCLWHSNSRYIRSCKRSERDRTSYFISRPLRTFEWATIVTVGKKFSDLTPALRRSCQFPQCFPQMRSFPSIESSGINPIKLWGRIFLQHNTIFYQNQGH